MARPARVVLIGGGLAGGLMAAYLGRAGCEVDLYERRSDPDAGNFVGGRSINLALSVRGIDALERVGLAGDILQCAIPMRGRMIHDARGGLHFQPYDRDPGRCIHSVGRAVLNRVTLNAARALPNVRVHFDARCTEVDLDRGAATLVRESPADEVPPEPRPSDGARGAAPRNPEPAGSRGRRSTSVFEAAGDLLLGVDGAFSTVRRSMQRLDRFDYSQRFLEHGYKELTIPPDAGGAHRMETHALHIWPRRSFMMIALPNPDGSFTCTLFFPFDGPLSFAALRDDDDVRRFFEAQFPDAVPLMPTLLEDFRRNPTGSMVTVRCRPWNVAGRVALLGDAAHAVVPFYGQGMNAAFEDCVVLDECLRRGRPSSDQGFEAALREYEARRRPHVDALADLAVANFVEMRDKTGSAAFRGYKRLERALHGALPWWYTPLYTMVSFTRTPYADAVRRARHQDRAVVGLGVAAALLLLALLLAVVALARTEGCRALLSQ